MNQKKAALVEQLFFMQFSLEAVCSIPNQDKGLFFFLNLVYVL
jgi:hypothetical protein